MSEYPLDEDAANAILDSKSPESGIKEESTRSFKQFECFHCTDAFTYNEAIEAGTTPMYAETYCSGKCEKADLEAMAADVPKSGENNS